MSIKQERVAKELKRYISKVIQEELKDPRIGFVTITDVEVTKDLKIAKVYYSILDSGTQKKNTVNALKSAIGYIKKLIGTHLKLRYTPELQFMEDATIKRVQGIYKILEDIKKEKKDEHREYTDDNK